MVNHIKRRSLQSNSALDSKLEEQLKVACTRINLAGDELEKVVQGALDANPAVKAAAGYLFHEDKHGDVAHSLKLLYQICGGIRRGDKKNERTMDLQGDENNPAWVEEWKKIRRKKEDIVGNPSSR